MAEFTFELRVCQWAERAWPPGSGGTDDTAAGAADRSSAVVVARQLGTEYRRWDTVVVECDPEGLRRRARFGERELDSDLLHVVRNAPAEWAWYRDALPDPGYPWRYVRAAVHRAADRGLVERRRGSNDRVELRRKWAYPDWVRRVVAVENKPDLNASAARDLAPQLERDVALALADEVWVATGETGAAVEPALLEDVPVEAGVLTVDATGEAAVAWHPRRLAVDEPGTRILERPDGARGRGRGREKAGDRDAGDRDASAARFEYADPDWKADKRLEIAERAYGKGWRAYDFPGCVHAEATPDGRPYCAQFDCVVKASRRCGSGCAAYESSPKPDVDVERLRDERTPWRRDPPGVVRRQSGLDRFG